MVTYRGRGGGVWVAGVSRGCRGQTVGLNDRGRGLGKGRRHGLMGHGYSGHAAHGRMVVMEVGQHHDARGWVSEAGGGLEDHLASADMSLPLERAVDRSWLPRLRQPCNYGQGSSRVVAV